ncbi:MAG: oligosaccharide flippase family protein [Cyanobacteria bacterium RI_101]|nr:oligosaccharide flippase family protein [Cyanobacteria bacterium RI_101]
MTNPLGRLGQTLGPGFQKIAKSFSWLLLERLVVMGTALTVGIYTVRYLGAAQFGKLSYAYSFVNIFEGLAKLGLDSVVIRNLVQNAQPKEKILGATFTLKSCALLGAVGISIGSFLSFNTDPTTNLLLIIIAFSLLFNSLDGIDFWFQSQVISQKAAQVRIGQFIISSILKLTFIYFQLSVIFFAGLYVLENALRALGFLWMYRRGKENIFHWRWDKKVAGALLRDAWPLILSSMMIILYMRVDQVMLGIIAGPKAVGLYSAAIRFSEIWYFIPVIICSSVFPAIIKAKSLSAEIYRRRLQYLYDFLVWLSLLLALGVSLVAYPLIDFLLGADFRPSALILIVHVWAIPFVFLGVARSQWLIAENLTRFSFLTTSLGAVANILLNLWLIPPYGGLGAALATLASYAIANYLSGAFFPSTRPSFAQMTQALFIPLRWRKNQIYLGELRTLLRRSSAPKI